MSGLRVLAPGPATSIQDLGRQGWQHMGMPEAGASDPIALRLANLLVGNEPGEGALEAFYVGPTLRVDADSVRVAVVGPTAEAEIREPGAVAWAAAPVNATLRLERGAVLRCRSGAACPMLILAVEGGFDVAPVLGSVSTLVRSGVGGFQGRTLREGDLLPLKAPTAPARTERVARVAWPSAARLRVLEGPQADYFDADAFDAFLAGRYTVGLGANRMGVRLQGPAVRHSKGFNITSDAVAPGAVQIPGDGQPIVLGADAQTTGGYPKIAAVISADLPLLARLPAGATVTFERVTYAQAVRARREQADWIARLPDVLRDAGRESLADVLFNANLIGGVVDARAGEGFDA